MSIFPKTFRNRLDYLPVERDEQNVTTQVASGSVWSGLSVGASTVLNLIRSMIFARLLMPEDFGILSLATVFTQFVLIFANFGVASSIIYHKELSKKDLSTCWWGNMFIDGTAALACIVIALISSKTSGDKTVAYVVGLLAVQFIISGFGSINLALMKRQFMFKKIAISNFCGSLFTFLFGWFFVVVFDLGVYGLCLGMISGSLSMTLMNFGFMPWVPSVLFSKKSLKKHLSYGRWFFGVNILAYLNGNVDRITINALLSKTQLGFYEYASNIPLMVATRLSTVLNGVLFSAFSSVQDKPKELRQLLLKIYRYNSMIIFPFLTGIALVAPDFIMVAYGEKWLPILTPLRLFCFFGILRLYSAPLQALCNGIGKPNLPFKWFLIYLPFNLVLLYIGVSQGGTTGAVVAKLILPIFSAITIGREVMREIELPWDRLLAATLPATLACLAMSLSVILVGHFLINSMTNHTLRLGLLVSTGGLIYMGFLTTFFRSDLIKVLNLARRLKGSK